jgi:two-component system cell cycle sensor histidine kinase/response regulator CckA
MINEKAINEVRLLIVEDSPTQAAHLKKLLEKQGYSVHHSVNGLDALRVASDYNPSLIISDIMMPKMDGYQLCREIKKHEKLRDIPFILLTSLSHQRDIIRGLECGADNFITKPYDDQDLLSRVWHILSNSELSQASDSQAETEVFFSGEKYLISSGRRQILGLLLSTYETAVQKNKELLQAQNALKQINENLEAMVEQRTAALTEEMEKTRKQARLLDLATDAILVRDFNDSILYWNRGAERLYGWTHDEALGKSASVLLQTQFSSTRTEIDDQFLQYGRWQGELIQTKRDGTQINVESHWTQDEGAGSSATVLEINTDVTEAKFLENQLRHVQKMEAVGRLAAGVAHDFNNLLTVILGRSRLVLARSSSTLETARDVELILNTGKRAAALTRQLLAFGRKQMIQPKVLSLNPIVQNMEEMLARLVGEEIELVSSPASELWNVRADAGQIEQVIMNLVVNARDAMPDGGTIRINTANVELDDTFARQHVGVPSGNYVMLRVRDTGCGMDPETKARIFEPFFTTKDVGKGTGLGLSTVYGIVEHSGGHILVDSEVGKGTAFSIYFPRVDEPVENLEQTEVASTGGSETILVVDDDDSVRELIRDLLEMDGYSVIEASDSEEATRICQEYDRPIDLMLTDLAMPKTNGRQLAQRVAALRPKMRFIYMSAYADAAAQHLIFDTRVPFISKPVTSETLSRKIREVLDSN